MGVEIEKQEKCDRLTRLNMQVKSSSN